MHEYFNFEWWKIIIYLMEKNLMKYEKDGEKPNKKNWCEVKFNKWLVIY